MRAVDFKHSNRKIAEHQPEYETLPALVLDGADCQVVTCWKLSPRERIKALFTGRVWASLMTFGQPLQPMRMSVDREKIYTVLDSGGRPIGWRGCCHGKRHESVNRGKLPLKSYIMEPIDFGHTNVVYAKEQDEHNNMPALRAEPTYQGHVVTCWGLSFFERLRVLFTGKIWVDTVTHNKPLYPVAMSTRRGGIYEPERTGAGRYKATVGKKDLYGKGRYIWTDGRENRPKAEKFPPYDARAYMVGPSKEGAGRKPGNSKPPGGKASPQDGTLSRPKHVVDTGHVPKQG
jgi:hypothetical protein